MLDTTTAQTQPAQTTSEPAAAPAAAEPATRASLASMFEAELEAEDDPKPAAAAPQATEAAAPADETSESVTAETTQDEADPAQPDPAPPVDGPSGMSEADRAVFAQLSPEMQSWVSKRETAMRADYTRKTQEVAEHRNAALAERQALHNALQQYDSILSRYTDVDIAPPDPALRETDPLTYDDQLSRYIQADHNRKVAAAERQRVQASQAEHYKAARAEAVAAEEQRLEALKSPLARTAPGSNERRKAVQAYAVAQGIPAEMLHQASAIEIVMLDKARLYDAAQSAQAKAKAVTAPPPKMVRPGPAKAIGRPSNVAAAARNIAAAPTRDNLAAAYLAQLNAGSL